MTVLKQQFGKLSTIAQHLLALCALIGLIGAAGAAQAQENAIESVSANQQGVNVIVKILMKNPVAKPPIGFLINSPARIVIDFAGTTNATGESAKEIGLGDVRNVNVVQAGERSRLVFNLTRPLNYATVVEGKAVIVTIDSSGGLATPVNAAGEAVVPVNKAPPGKLQIRDIDFRRGVAGEGRIVVDLPSSQVGVDVRQQGQTIVVDFLKSGLPDVLRRRMDVGDFGTPVRFITTAPQGDNVHMVIEPKGLWEHSAYQSDTQLVIEVRPVKEEPNKLSQGTQGYRGEKLSLNFQNVEVRSLLQVIADFTGLNIITSDTVSGNLTLRLKDVPWDQALDIVMQAKGLDMRKNGTVIWIAPKDELLTKEKLELEQRAQIAELEPLKTETFQLNYQKADAFKMVFGLDSGSGDGKNRILSKRGSAAIDPRTNKLIVTDIPSKLEEVRKLILITDVATRQVLIEARIVEADDTFSKNLGAKLGFTDLRTARGGESGYQLNGNTRVGLTGNYLGVGEQTGQATVTDGSFIPNSQFVSLPAAGINGLNAGSLAVSLFSAAANRFLNLELSALEADGRGKVISSPRVVTADQQQALIEQGEEIPYQKATSSGATSVEFKKANLKLEVTPQITPDGNIILSVDVNKDSRGAPAPGGFAINTKHVKTNVQVENGGTVVLGGIFTQRELDSVTKIPFFGDIPVLGNLFKTTGRTNDKTELLIFITPKIVAERLSSR
ncbi:type IV pilus secretin PilQ [Actimicrobium sp. CCI2.3]|uniref:type IV pilus secretin PilQ n=1 Tax=Actimicrobium sp. CCI2.3 TaxID=3048616 RepID=UPI002AB588FE|nr:type IV pilus secretin PilQ [Actimicrobium sp. CCI2.3]MDY7573335.1 type IV pilus secretin PilQ [Actimicrobium sp. CCI2.3]MEB0021732.1 type IV pilus secretin PilQ [Actimicrobium sp. CCI2.3]